MSDSDLDDEDDMYFDRLEYKNLTPEMEKVAPLSRVPVILYWNEYFFNEFKVTIKEFTNTNKHCLELCSQRPEQD